MLFVPAADYVFENVLQGYHRKRIISFLGIEQDATFDWNVNQSKIAIGSGGLLGTGLGKGRQKFLYLPEESNDFIFSTVCEELGLIGASLILLVFALLLLRGFWIALHARDRFGTLLVVGVMSHLGLRGFLNVAVVTGLVPATGISLPFFSYGGSSLVAFTILVFIAIRLDASPTKGLSALQ